MRLQRTSSTRWLPTAVFMLLATACGGDEPTASDDGIDRETFISTYVDLRVATVSTEDLELSEAQRDSILGVHGVDGASLLRFTDLHGRDLDYMTEVWNEIERRMEEATPPES